MRSAARRSAPTAPCLSPWAPPSLTPSSGPWTASPLPTPSWRRGTPASSCRSAGGQAREACGLLAERSCLRPAASPVNACTSASLRFPCCSHRLPLRYLEDRRLALGPTPCPAHICWALPAGRTTPPAACCPPTAAPRGCTTAWPSSTLTLRPRWPNTCTPPRWSSATQVRAHVCVCEGVGAGRAGSAFLRMDRTRVPRPCLWLYISCLPLRRTSSDAGSAPAPCKAWDEPCRPPLPTRPPQAPAASLRRCACAARWWWCPTRCSWTTTRRSWRIRWAQERRERGQGCGFCCWQQLGRACRAEEAGGGWELGLLGLRSPARGLMSRWNDRVARGRACRQVQAAAAVAAHTCSKGCLPWLPPPSFQLSNGATHPPACAARA